MKKILSILATLTLVAALAPAVFAQQDQSSRSSHRLVARASRDMRPRPQPLEHEALHGMAASETKAGL